MERILYIGNKLQKDNSNISYISILGQLLEKEQYTIYYASGFHNKVLRLLHMIFSFFRHKRDVAVVLIDTYSTHNFYYAYIISQLCKLYKIKYIPILHGGNLPSRLKNNPKMSRSIFGHSQVNVSPSAYLKNIFESYGYSNITHIPNTIEVSLYPQKIRSYDAPKLLWVRSFSRIYNPELAIQVLHEIKKKFPNAELCMVGPDADGSLLHTKALAQQYNLDVKFTGKLSKTEWIELSNNYNIFINTTNFDNTPLSVIEAMALGLPVVSTNAGGMPFLIEHKRDGLLVPPEQAQDMSRAINVLMEQAELRDKLIHNARQKVEQFDWQKVKVLWSKILTVDNS